MEVSSVGSSIVALQQQLSSARSAQENYAERATEQAQLGQESSRTEATGTNTDASRSEAVQARERTEEARQVQQQRVFVNAQGQKTGTIINVAA